MYTKFITEMSYIDKILTNNTEIDSLIICHGFAIDIFCIIKLRKV